MKSSNYWPLFILKKLWRSYAIYATGLPILAKCNVLLVSDAFRTSENSLALIPMIILSSTIINMEQ